MRRDGGPGRLFATFADDVDRDRFLGRTSGDPHQFRLILSPEDGSAYADLKAFTRDVMARMELDLDTNLDWVAAEHYNTGRPHVHVMIRGVTETGRALNIAGDYLRFGIAYHASEVLTRDLGLEMEIEAEHRLARQFNADRFTDLDQELMDRAVGGLIDLTSWSLDTDSDRSLHQQVIARARCLEQMGLAVEEEPMKWALSSGAIDVLREMDHSARRIDALHRAVKAAKLTRPLQLYRVHHQLEDPIVGCVIAHDHAPDRPGRNYVVLDGIDGRVHYVDIGMCETNPPLGGIIGISPRRTESPRADSRVAEIAAANGGRYDIETHLRFDPAATVEVAEAYTRRLEAINRVTGTPERNADGSWNIGANYIDLACDYERSAVTALPVVIDILSRLPLSRQVHAEGATWLDRQLVEARSSNHELYGFGRDIHEALIRRQQWLIEQGLIMRDGDRVVYRDKFLDQMLSREVRQIAHRFEGELHKPFVNPSADEPVEGLFRQIVELNSGRFALLEKSYEFTLVPWKPELERYLGKEISGVQTDGVYDWTLGRTRGLSV